MLVVYIYIYISHHHQCVLVKMNYLLHVLHCIPSLSRSNTLCSQKTHTNILKCVAVRWLLSYSVITINNKHKCIEIIILILILYILHNHNIYIMYQSV